jgi:hypothetical protein
MTAFNISIEIQAPPHVVWAIMSDVERWHEWTASVTSIRRFDRGPLLPGQRVVIRQPKFPPALWRLTSIHEGRSFEWVSRAPGISVFARHSVEGLDGRSRVTLALEFAGLLGPLFGRMTAGINNRYLKLEAEGLKRRAESVAMSAVEAGPSSR